MYTFDSRIRYSESDSEGHLSLEGLLDYFQDCSTFHSEDVGVGMGYLQERNLVWVLSSWQIVVDRYPDICEEVTIGTYPYEFQRCFGYRNFVMAEKETGRYLAKANTLWTLLDWNTMRPARFTDRMENAYVLEEKLDMEYSPRKILVPEGGREEEPLLVQQHHLDTNKHVNNVQYIRMGKLFLPDNCQVKQLRAEYKKQAHLHDKICPYVIENNGTYLISLRDEEGTIYANVEFAL